MGAAVAVAEHPPVASGGDESAELLADDPAFSLCEGGLYRFRIQHTCFELRLVSVGELRHDRGSCPSVCCT